MEKRKTITSSGEWEYLRCSETKFFNKCFVTCGVDRAENYLESVKRQLHGYYKDPNKIGMKCYCRKSAVLTLSNSDKNPGRLYFKCPKRECRFFQWADVEPRGLVNDRLESKSTPCDSVDGRFPNRDENGYPTQGYDMVPNRFHDDRMIPDVLIPGPEIPFDEALWNECQTCPIYMGDNTIKIDFPQEIRGHYFTIEKEPHLRQQIYTLRVLAKNKKRE